MFFVTTLYSKQIKNRGSKTPWYNDSKNDGKAMNGLLSCALHNTPWSGYLEQLAEGRPSRVHILAQMLTTQAKFVQARARTAS